MQPVLISTGLVYFKMHSQVSRASVEAAHRMKKTTNIAPVFMLHLTCRTRRSSQHGTCKQSSIFLRESIRRSPLAQYLYQIMCQISRYNQPSTFGGCHCGEIQLEARTFHGTCYVHFNPALV